MVLATKQAFDLIQQANFKQVDRVFTNNIPSDVGDDQTIILITDVLSKPDLYGNNHIITMDKQVEVQIFYTVDIDYDPDELESPLIELFDNAGWELKDVRGHTVDPDTSQMTATYYFQITNFL